MYLASERGRRVLNFGYSWGASVVIIGALFKILHLPMGNAMLSIGMITEFIVFIIYGFERPSSEYHWENVFPGLKSDNPLDQVHFTGNIGGNGGGFSGGNGGFAGGGFAGGGFAGGGFSGSPFTNSDSTVEGNEVNPPSVGGSFAGGGFTGGGFVGGGIVGGFTGGNIGGGFSGGENSGGGTVIIGGTEDSASGSFSGTIVIGGNGSGATGSSEGNNMTGSTVVIGGGSVAGTGGGFSGGNGGFAGGGFAGTGGGFIGSSDAIVGDSGSAGNGSVAGSGGGFAGTGGGIVGGGTIVGNGETIDLSGLAALEVTEEDAQTLSNSIKKLNDAAGQISKMGELTEVTEKYVEQLSSISGNMERFGQAICSLTELSDGLFNSYKHITDNSDGVSQHARSYVQQMESLNRNISGLNTIYEIQLKSISSQIETIEHINSGLIRIREMYDGSVVDSSVFHNETEKMTRQLTELNKVYTRLLQALTTNVAPAPPTNTFNY
jgi:uncharacterized protein YukE